MSHTPGGTLPSVSPSSTSRSPHSSIPGSVSASPTPYEVPSQGSKAFKLPLIRNAQDAKELEEEKAAKAAAKKHKAALTPAEKRAAKLRAEQAREEAEAQAKLKAKILAEKKAARRSSGTGIPSGDGTARSLDGSVAVSAAPSGRASAVGMRPGDGSGVNNVEIVENADGTFSAVQHLSPDQAQMLADDADEEAAQKEAEEAKKAEENYDIIFDGPKSPLIMATAARHIHEMLRLIQEVPIEYRVEFVNAYDDHGCSAIFFAIGPEHQDCMQLLLDYGADPNHQNNKKNGPLHIACAIQNKKAMRVLIEHGANIQLENWQYQKPHEMVTERDKVSSTQAYLNQIVEAFAEKVANKEVFANITRHGRSYYRSLFDIADTQQLGALKLDVIERLLTTLAIDGSGNVVKADPKWVFTFFKGLDTDKNGIISFPEFLHRVTIINNEKERIRKKLKRKQMLAAKRKKAREAAAAKKAKLAAAAEALAQEQAVQNAAGQ